MDIFGSNGYSNGYSNGTTYTFTSTNNASGTTTFIGVPVTVVPAPELEGPLDWLHRRINEVCEEAFAA